MGPEGDSYMIHVTLNRIYPRLAYSLGSQDHIGMSGDILSRILMAETLSHPVKTRYMIHESFGLGSFATDHSLTRPLRDICSFVFGATRLKQQPLYGLASLLEINYSLAINIHQFE